MSQPPTERASQRPPRGLLVAFEGGDGAGKSTQVRLLTAALEAAGRSVVVTRQPGGTPLGAEIRQLVMHGGHVSPRAEALLYAADKAHHVDELIRPALESGQDFDEGAEVLDARDAAVVDAADLGLSGALVDLEHRALHALGVVAEDFHRTVVLDVDLDAERIGDASNVLAAGAD